MPPLPFLLLHHTRGEKLFLVSNLNRPNLKLWLTLPIVISLSVVQGSFAPSL